ncbi:hypothetical protein EV127DRAFT_465155 [Xylaria flabelliformis]|nr:hypothetical protein EV127DRAFT_465155 [Xylaria flabelliformis]
MAPRTNTNPENLATLVDFYDVKEGEYRVLVDGKHVKYLTVDPVLIEILLPFPPGDWNEGHISKHLHTGHPFFSRTTKSDLPGVKNLWHHTQIDHLELKQLDRITHPLFESPVIAKFIKFPWQTPYFEAETTAYDFLGIGLIIENVDGARAAEVADLPAFRSALAKLHSLGIVHGDINKHNFLMHNGKATLIDFESARKSGNEVEFESEFQGLEHLLSDTSGRGGVGIPVVSDYLAG